MYLYIYIYTYIYIYIIDVTAKRQKNIMWRPNSWDCADLSAASGTGVVCHEKSLATGRGSRCCARVDVRQSTRWKWLTLRHWNHGPVESLWVFPLNMVVFHSYVNVYQRLSGDMTGYVDPNQTVRLTSKSTDIDPQPTTIITILSDYMRLLTQYLAIISCYIVHIYHDLIVIGSSLLPW